RFCIDPTREITFGASNAPTWMICDTSRLNANPSFDRTVIDCNFSSYLCASVRVAQFNTMFVVGTNSTFITRVLSGCLPGYNGVTHTPLWPGFTRSPCLNSTPLTSTCAWPTNEMTTPMWPIGICTIGTCSTCANHG